MTVVDYFQTNTWYQARPNPQQQARSAVPVAPGTYPLPQTLLRNSVGATSYIYRATVIADHVRAAAIVAVPHHSLLDVPWSMIAYHRDYTMIIASVGSVSDWIAQARQCGARAWLRTNGRSVYQWTDDSLSAQGSGPVQRYDRAGMQRAVESGTMSLRAIASQYGVCLTTVQRLSRRLAVEAERG
ncbi:hypothetical protein UFOVP700_12 [uncultured Caudovirales phage]|uniref:Uncharacterized protein n=1 Tax=uncultured Caudovirales phage TaxID=2100421 RepID=A0A6J5NI27_9CAUD|nr:hypothetical protein UFOVP700_12 [uncultured Caudovirales phage]